MAFKLIQLIVIAAVIAATLTEPPVRIDEQHLRNPESQGSGNGWQDSVPGLPGKDYPNLSSIPKTSFTCADKTPGGYYADVETRCQVFHVCNTEGTKSSFLCPSGSIFNQQHFVCDWWYDFECERAPDLYSLNEALDDQQSTNLPNAPLPYNSIGASNNDLSLASSGYPNSIRDEANMIYEDYASGKIIEADGNSIPEKLASGAPVGSIRNYIAGAVTLGLSSSDNYSDSHRRESTEPGRLNGREQHRTSDYQLSESDAQTQNANKDRRYGGSASQSGDNVPRGFSKARTEHLNRNDNGPGFFVNNGLFEERNKKQDSTLFRESSDFINNQYSEFKKNKENTVLNENSNGVRYGIYYQNPEKYPLPQENNNYVNNDNDNNDNKTNHNYNKNEIHSNSQYNGSTTFENYYKNTENFESSTRTSSEYENYYEKSESVESSSSSSSGIYDFTGEPYNRILEYAATTSRAISMTSAPTEDEVDREWQRVVDSTELKRNSAQRSNYDYESSASFLIREESGHPWREDLTTSSSGLPRESPGYPSEVQELPENGYSNYDSPSTLSRPEEPTTPTAKEKPKFLGRRPTGGLLSGAGNGLPGANKVLAGSVSITGKPAQDTASTVGPSSINEAWSSQHSYQPRNQANKVNDFVIPR